MSIYLGLDLGGTNVKAAAVRLVDGTHEILDTATVPSNAEEGPEGVAEVMISLGRSMIDSVGSVNAVGIGVPGLFDFATGEIVFFTNLPGKWEAFPLRSTIAGGLDLPATLINDARAFTLAEATVGAGEGCRNVACITLGTGVGGGLFINGELHFGAFGIGGELGHQTLDPNGPMCGCGNPGCMEALTRPPAVAERAGKRTFEEVIEAAARREPRAERALDDAIEFLGMGLANVVTMVGPERIIIGGGGAAAGELLIGAIRDSIRSRVTLVPPELIEVVPAILGSTAGAVGAAIAAIESPTKDARFLAGEIPSATKRRQDSFKLTE